MELADVVLGLVVGYVIGQILIIVLIKLGWMDKILDWLSDSIW